MNSSIPPLPLTAFAIAATTALGVPSLPAQTPTADAPTTHPVALAPWEKIVSVPAEAAPYYRVTLGTPVTGWVETVHADLGSSVSKGEILAEVRAPELVAASEARAEEARASQQKVAQATAMLESAKASARAAESEARRLLELVRSGAVTSRASEEAEARAAAAQAKVGEAEAGIAAAEADALAAAARATEAAAALEYTRLAAPFDGLVVERHAELGDYLGPGGRGAKLFVLEQVDPLRVRVHLPEHAAPLADAGDAVAFSASGREFEATLERVAASLDPVTRTVSAEFDLAGSGLLPGTYGTATVRLASLESAAILPLAALRTEADGARYVLVRLAEGGERAARVVLHAVEGGKAVVTGDLVAGQLAILP